MTPRLEFHPLTPDRWPDLERLFGPRGAIGGCWCMWWRITRSEFEGTSGDEKRSRFRSIVRSGEVPGILCYEGNAPIGWCSIAPRESFPVLDRSRVLKRVDDQPVWSIVCFVVAKDRRGTGIGSALIDAAVAHAGRAGARIVEAYPVEPKADRTPDIYAFTGVTSMFSAAGFEEVERRSPTRPIMRLTIDDGA